MRRVTTLVVIIWATMATLTPASADAQIHNGHVAMLRVAVDGSRTPAMIPDETAYRHLVLAAACHRIPTRAEVVRRQAMLAGIGLSVDDQTQFGLVLFGVKERLDVLEQQASVAPTTDPAVLISVRDQRNRTLDDTYKTLWASLSGTGQQQLVRYVHEHIKPRIVIYGDPR
jgi:hypothetical protein